MIRWPKKLTTKLRTSRKKLKRNKKNKSNCKLKKKRKMMNKRKKKKKKKNSNLLTVKSACQSHKKKLAKVKILYSNIIREAIAWREGANSRNLKIIMEANSVTINSKLVNNNPMVIIHKINVHNGNQLITLNTVISQDSNNTNSFLTSNSNLRIFSQPYGPKTPNNNLNQ